LARTCSNVLVIVILDAETLAEDLDALGQDGTYPVLLVQLLSQNALVQYLEGMGETGKRLLSLADCSLYDIAKVPWLLSHLLRQSQKPLSSRSGVMARIVDGNMAGVAWPPGVRRTIATALGRIAWTMQKQQSQRLSGRKVFEIINEVRVPRDISLDELQRWALQTQQVCLFNDDSLRFAYPGFQSYWCARYLVSFEEGMWEHLDDITATLGRRSRVELWQDTLVLLTGMISDPDRLVRRIVEGSSLSQGAQLFLATTCVHEARLSKHEMSQEVVCHILDNLVWRSTVGKENTPSVRIAALEHMALLRDPSTIPHLFGIAFERVRADAKGEPRFELSGVRQVALQVLLNMMDETETYLQELLKAPNPNASLRALPPLIRAWKDKDSGELQRIVTSDVEGVPAIAVFALEQLGAQDVKFLVDQLQGPLASDTCWAIAEALLPLNPAEVTHAIRPLYSRPDRRGIAAYVIGELRSAITGDSECQFLRECLRASCATTQGLALRALAQLGDNTVLKVAQSIATGNWDSVHGNELPIPTQPAERGLLRYYALETLRVIGTPESAARLRLARHRPEQDWPDNFMTLSYEVSEDIYSRCAAGQQDNREQRRGNSAASS
jgi:hypothetical protein